MTYYCGSLSLSAMHCYCYWRCYCCLSFSVVLCCCFFCVSVSPLDSIYTAADVCSVLPHQSLPHIIYPERHPSLSGEKPPQQMPDSLLPYFTRCGLIPNETMYIDDTWGGKGSHYKFSTANIQSMINRVNNIKANTDKRQRSKEKDHLFFEAMDKIQHAIIQGKTALVMGSQEPWYESILLAYGATLVVTMEYNQLTYRHSQMLTTTPDEFREGNYTGPRVFDLVVAVSCVDHDGLGRYGDPLAPDGDLLTMQEILTFLKPEGKLILATPIGPDLIVWNLERRYGPIRLPLLLHGWTVNDRIGWKEERLIQAANYRQRFEPILVLAPNRERGKETHQDLR